MDGPDFAAGVANVLAAMEAGFFDVLEVFHEVFRKGVFSVGEKPLFARG